MKGKRVIAGIWLVGILVGILIGCKNTDGSKKETQKPVITLGSDNYPPYNYLNEDGIPTGIDVELATEAFKRMGYQVEVVKINWEKKKELVESGEIDCIMGCFSMEGRLDDYRWAGPYIASRQVVAVNKNSDIYRLSDLEGKNLAVQSTTKPEGIFLNRTDERIPKLGNLISLGHRELIYTFLGKGYVDAVAAHEESIVQYMKDYDTSFRILEEPLMVKVRFDLEANVKRKIHYLKQHRSGASITYFPEENQLEYQDTIRGLGDFANYLRQFGRSVHVIEPASLKDKMNFSIDRTLSRYEEDEYE